MLLFSEVYLKVEQMARFLIFSMILALVVLPAATPLGNYGPSGVPTQNPITKDRLPELTKQMKLIPARDTSFMMGFTGKIGGNSKSKPPFKVHFSYDFYMDTTEVTVKEFKEVYQYAWNHGLIRVDSSFSETGGQKVFEGVEVRNNEKDSAYFLFGTRNDYPVGLDVDLKSKTFLIKGNPNLPIHLVSWYGAVFFCYIKNIMNSLEPVVDLDNWTFDFSKNGYRLPTEAEWEFTARAFSPNYLFEFEDDPEIVENRWSTRPFRSKKMMEIVNKVARSHAPYVYSARYIFQEVGLVKPNRWGIYDLRGNAAEIMLDTYSPFDTTEKKDHVVLGKFFRAMIWSSSDKQDMVVSKPSGSQEMWRFVKHGWGDRRLQVRSLTANSISFRTVLPVK